MRAAAIDIGTNSTACSSPTSTGPTATLVTLDRRMTITRLGQGVDATAPARARGDRAHRRRAARVPRRDRRDRRRRRGARDRDDRGARRDEPRRLLRRRDRDPRRRARAARGSEEARLSFLGATTGLADGAPAPYLVVDIGGGSTEFVVGTDEPEGLMSVDIGCVRLTEAGCTPIRPTPEELSQAVHVVREHLADVAARGARRSTTAKTLVGLAGTVSTLRRDRARPRRVRPRPDPPLPPHPGRGRGRVPHPRDRAGRRAAPQSRARAGAGRRDRRRRDRPRDGAAHDRASTSCSSRGRHPRRARSGTLPTGEYRFTPRIPSTPAGERAVALGVELQAFVEMLRRLGPDDLRAVACAIDASHQTAADEVAAWEDLMRIDEALRRRAAPGSPPAPRTRPSRRCAPPSPRATSRSPRRW